MPLLSTRNEPNTEFWATITLAGPELLAAGAAGMAVAGMAVGAAALVGAAAGGAAAGVAWGLQAVAANIKTTNVVIIKWTFFIFLSFLGYE